MMSEPIPSQPQPIERLTFDAAALMREHPPKLNNGNKRVVFDVACPDGTAGGRIEYSQWRAMPLPPALEPDTPLRVDARPDVYDYAPVDASQPAVEWHVNFADPRLFVAYGSRLLAQDEMQAAEHPVLGSLREALLARGDEPLTVD